MSHTNNETRNNNTARQEEKMLILNEKYILILNKNCLIRIFTISFGLNFLLLQ